jgi:hypothetical protein
LSEMDSILRELGLEVERRREAEVEAPGPTTPVGWEPVPPRREEGQPTAAYAPPPPIPPIAEPRYAAVSEIEDDEKRHEEFHQRYMAPTASRTRVSAPRIRRRLRLTRRALRDAVVWREILGPPKGLR